ncbi:MAG TPA: right-handed parallel beta-helix repeat-containing protein [Anaerolineae bacterium]|nr:right-handed parallel beta-helix repeat-containing protein [Anaerolineae bacterium]
MRFLTLLLAVLSGLFLLTWAYHLPQALPTSPPTSQSPLTLTVNTPLDTLDITPGDGLCATAATTCSLRAAVTEANASPGLDTIIIPTGTFTLTTPAGSGEPDITIGDLNITDDLIIRGAGPHQTIIDGGHHDRIFDIPCPEDPICSDHSPTIYIEDLTIRHGFAYQGAGLANNGATLSLTNLIFHNNRSYGQGGGALYNHTGLLTVTHTTLISNTIVNSGYGSGAGGALYNWQGQSWLINTHIQNNTAYRGAAIYNYSSGQLTLINTTLTHNHADDAGGGLYNRGSATIARSLFTTNTGATGAAIYSQEGSLTLTNSTLHANAATNAGGGLYATNFLLTYTTLSANIPTNLAGNNGQITASILNHHPTHTNCHPTLNLTSLGHNLTSDTSCPTTQPTDLNDTPPLLAPLMDNGGPTLSQAPLPTSPALNHIPYDQANCATTTTDQRGSWRPTIAACDIGAIEHLGHQTFIPLTHTP